MKLKYKSISKLTLDIARGGKARRIWLQYKTLGPVKHATVPQFLLVASSMFEVGLESLDSSHFRPVIG